MTSKYLCVQFNLNQKYIVQLPLFIDWILTFGLFQPVVMTSVIINYKKRKMNLCLNSDMSDLEVSEPQEAAPSIRTYYGTVTTINTVKNVILMSENSSPLFVTYYTTFLNVYHTESNITNIWENLHGHINIKLMNDLLISEQMQRNTRQ